MAAAASTYFANKIIDHCLRNQAFTPPAIVYLALFSASTGLDIDNPSAELSGNGYARVACTLNAASGKVTANTSDLTFAAVTTADWVTITHTALVDHATNVTWGSNVHVLTYGTLTPNKTPTVGDIFKILAGNLDISVGA